VTQEHTNTVSASRQDHNGFWARQSQKDKVVIIALAVQLALSVGLLLAGLLDLGIGKRFALSTGTIAALVVSLQFAIRGFFVDQTAEIDKISRELQDIKSQISRTLEEMESIAGLGETYVKIFRQSDEIKNQYQSSLDFFLRRLSNCIDDKRSGALNLMEYYGVLENLASRIEGDKASGEIAGQGYNGGIWALSFVLDNEWDDSDIYEAKWFETLKRVDRGGIPTRRLWAFDKEMRTLLTREPIEEAGRELVRRLSLYCANDTAFKNTVSYALPKESIIDEHVRLFGKGFFAAAFSGGGLSLIRGVCFDNLLSSNSLGGEIDYDETRIRQIRLHWERYLALAKPLKEYLADIASSSAKEFMKTSWNASIAKG